MREDPTTWIGPFLSDPKGFWIRRASLSEGQIAWAVFDVARSEVCLCPSYHAAIRIAEALNYLDAATQAPAALSDEECGEIVR